MCESSPHRSAIIGCVALALTLGLIADPPALAALPPAEATFRIELSAMGSFSSEGNVEATDRRAGGGSGGMRPGDRGAGYVELGPANGGIAPCGSGSSRPEPDDGWRGSTAWGASFELVELGDLRHTFRFEWTRVERRGDDHVVVDQGAGTAVLAPGEHLFIDAVVLETERGTRHPWTAALTLERDAPQNASKLYRVDLWSTHDHPGGRETSQATAHIRGGQSTEIRSAPLRLDSGARFADGLPLDIVIDLVADVTLHPLQSGQIEIRLRGHRMVSTAARGEAHSGGFGDGGFRRFIVDPGEVVRLPFQQPVYFGTSSRLRPGHRMPDGDQQSFDFRAAYETREDSITLQVQPIATSPSNGAMR